MSINPRGPRLPRTIRSLFSTQKRRDNPHKRFPDEYFKTLWVSRKMHNGVELIARIEGISKKAAADKLLVSGISRYLAELLKRHAENERLNRERAEGVEMIATLDGIKQVRKYLAEHGMSEYRSKKGGL